MKRISEFAPLAVKCWAVHQNFRKLGFASKDIYVSFARNAELQGGPPWLFIVLRTQNLEFTYSVGPRNDDEQFKKDWSALVSAFNAREIEEADLDEAYLAHCGNRPQFVAALLAKGFRIPVTMS